MRFNAAPWNAVGLAVALTLGAAQAATAQTPTTRDTTTRKATPTTPRATSSERIPISKQSPGEVALPDTASPPPPPPPAPVVIEQPPAPPAPLVAVTPLVTPRPRIWPLYFLVGAGPMLGSTSGSNTEFNEGLCIPGGANDPISTAHRNGYTALAGVGYDAPFSPLGVRFDVAYSTFDTYANNDPTGRFNFSSRPKLWSANLDLRLRAPFGAFLPPHFDVYGIGGGTYNTWKVTDVQNGPQNPENFESVTSWQHTWGYNYGVGGEYTWRNTALFLESRWFRFNDVKQLNHVPIVLGVRFF